VRQQALSHWLRDARTLPDLPKKPPLKKATRSVEDKARIVSEAAKLDGDDVIAHLERGEPAATAKLACGTDPDALVIIGMIVARLRQDIADAVRALDRAPH